ncbi:MAG: metallopeptidase family protein [Ktedonobacteraceae bacterium]
MDNKQHMHSPEEYDYNREPPLDQATTSMNRHRSKYVFTTLSFLLALLLFYSYLNGGRSDWFPLLGAVVLGILGVVFLRSSDSPYERRTASLPMLKNVLVEEDTPKAPLSDFEKLVQEALVSVPDEFQAQMENVSVHVVYEPDQEVLSRVGVKDGQTLLGLYEGVPLTSYGRDNSPYPEVITIYQRPIEDHCRHNPTRIREQVRATVLHEIAHHFGMGHAEMPIWLH